MRKVVALSVLVGIMSYLASSARFYRADNFSAGPSSLPLDVLLHAQREFASYAGSGMAIFEMSHRDAGGPVQTVMAAASADLRALLAVPASHTILHLQGGAHAQFAAVPLQMLPDARNRTEAVYVITGYWSARAADEAERLASAIPGASVRRVAGLTPDGRRLAAAASWGVDPARTAYVYVCASETIDGAEFHTDPALPAELGVPLVGDFTSTLLSRPVNVSLYGVIFASGGKNLGPSGFAVVLVDSALLATPAASSARVPSVLSWRLQAESRPLPSLYHTPPVWALWMHSLVLAHAASAHGGIAGLHARAARRAAAIFAAADATYAPPEGGAGRRFYYHPVDAPDRSAMSVPLTIGGGGAAAGRAREVEEKFIAEARALGMTQLFGHPARGGLRVTLYNGVPDDAVERLAAFMRAFAARNVAALAA